MPLYRRKCPHMTHIPSSQVSQYGNIYSKYGFCIVMSEGVIDLHPIVMLLVEMS